MTAMSLRKGQSIQEVGQTVCFHIPGPGAFECSHSHCLSCSTRLFLTQFLPDRLPEKRHRKLPPSRRLEAGVDWLRRAAYRTETGAMERGRRARQ